MKVFIYFQICFVLVFGSALFAEEGEASDAEALALGRQVLAVKAALENPESADSLQTITALGQDSRYYVMVRGWVVQHIQMAESFRETSGYRNSPPRRLEVEERIRALNKALRHLDLE